MAARRGLYLAALAGCILFYIAYGQWLSWLVLLVVLGLPWFSLLLSLPALLTFRAGTDGPAVLTMGQEGELWVLGRCTMPMPLFRARIWVKRCITGESWDYEHNTELLTAHCGGLTATLEGLRVYDYLGLFSFRLRCRDRKQILVRPKPVPMTLSADLERIVPRAWKPKIGGGFAENHELRLYRPGDSLNQVHWKLTAKTGNLMIRQAMEPQEGLILLTMNLRGTNEEIDRKFGRLLWLGRRLLRFGLPFELRCLTGEGLLTFSICTRAALNKAVDDLLCHSAAEEGDLQQTVTAVWHCHIGGQADET